MAPKFKVGSIIIPNDFDRVVVKKFKVINITTHYYRFLILDVEPNSSFTIGKEYTLEVDSIDRRYKLDQEGTDRVELEQDIKETFNGG